MSQAQETQALQQPPVPITSPYFQYNPSCGTNIARTLARFGFELPDRERQARMKLLLNGVNPDAPLLLA